MNKYLKYFLGVVLVSVFMFFFEGVGYILAVALALLLLIMVCYLAVGLIGYVFHKRISYRILKAIAIVALFISYALAFNLFTGKPPVMSASNSVEEQLEYMYQTDQSDRVSFRILNFNRDKQRLERVLQYHNDSLIISPEDAYKAALILQHGKLPEHYELAYRYAIKAKEGGLKRAEWLSEATYDRWMVSIGKPQKFNTQTNIKF